MSTDIERLRAVGRAATEGPWESEEDACSEDGLDYTPSRVWTDGGVDYWGEANNDYVLAQGITNEDAEFIATARNEWDALLDEVEALRARCERAETRLSKARAHRTLHRLRAERAEAKVAQVEALADEWDHLGYWMRGAGSMPNAALTAVREQVEHMAACLRAALADESASDGLSRPGTTSVELGDAGSLGGRQIGGNGIEGGK